MNSAAYTSLSMKFGVYTMSILNSINRRFTTCNHKFYRVVNVLHCIGMLFFNRHLILSYMLKYGPYILMLRNVHQIYATLC